MRLHRFFLENKIIDEKVIVSDTDLLYQWQKVFRFKPGNEIIVFDGTGCEYKVVFDDLSKDRAVLVVKEKKEIDGKQKVELHIFQSIIKKDNFEFVVQKCTEIGATAFHPILSERSEKKDLNILRLRKIAKEASEQSGRNTIPDIFEPKKMEEAVKDFDGKVFVLDFDGKSVSDIEVTDKVAILVGPEGGWSDPEKTWLKEKKIVSISLGRQVLRAETASISASALILLEK